MTRASMDDGQPTMPLLPFDTPFLVSMRLVDAVGNAEVEWWDAWLSLYAEAARDDAPGVDRPD